MGKGTRGGAQNSVETGQRPDARSKNSSIGHVDAASGIYNYSADAGLDSDTLQGFTTQPGWRVILLGTAAAGALWFTGPRPAKAGPQLCTNVAPTATCEGNQSAGIASGIDFPAAYTDLIVQNLNTDIAPAGADGIYFHGATTVSINSDTSPYSINALGGDGIDAHAPDEVYINHTGDITAGLYGIIAVSDNESVILHATGDVDGQGGDSVHVQASGDVGIYTTGDLTGAIAGINAVSSNSHVYIDSDGDIVSDYIGIRVRASTDATILQTGDVTSTSHAGIHARSYTGSVDIDVDGDVEALTNYGIWGYADAGSVFIKATGDVDSAATAIRAYAPLGAVDVEHDGGHVISTDSGVAGISAYSNAGSVRVENHGDVTADGHGIEVRATGAAGDANVYQYGDINSTYANRAGILALSQSGNTEVYLDGEITSVYDGIHAHANTGDVYVHTPGDIEAGHKGIYAYANGSAVVKQNGDITTTAGTGAQAIDVHASTGNATVESYGDLDSGAQQAIRVFAAGEVYVTIDDGDVNGATAGVQVDAVTNVYLTIGEEGSLTADNDLAVNMIGGADADVEIAGYVRGFMQFDADDDVYVIETGDWRATDTTNFDLFGGGGTDRVFNGGIVRTSDYGAGATERVYFENLEELRNGDTGPGVTGSGPALITMVNDYVGDIFAINFFSVTEVAFVGTGNSTLAVDAYLSDLGSSDVLDLNGNTDGFTGVVVNNTNPNGSTPNYTGIPVVIVDTVTGPAGPTDEDDFDLAYGPLQAGFWTWDLVLDTTFGAATDHHELITVGPSSLGDALAIGITSAQEIWHQTSGVWLERQADLRNQLNAPGGSMTTADLGGKLPPPEPLEGSSVTPGVWAKGIGVWAERDAEFTIPFDPVINPNGPTTFDLDHDLDITGVMGGIDFGHDDAVAGSAFLFGLLGGYIWSDLDFDAGGGAKFEGPTVGGYATFIRGGFFADALVKADFLDIDLDATPFGGAGTANTDVTNIGGRLDTGFRFGNRFFFEPQGTIAYVHTEIDDVSLLLGDVSFEEGESLRGRAGARIGAVFETANVIISPDVGGGVWHEFLGDNEVNVSGFPVALPTFSDSPDETVGELSGGISVASRNGWSVFGRGKWQKSDDFEALSVHGGARFSW